MQRGLTAVSPMQRWRSDERLRNGTGMTEHRTWEARAMRGSYLII